jgi:phage terminase large subunit GpA-like protein
VPTKRTKQILAYKLDLTKIDGKGDFLCPQCGTKISPDDESEETYSILETKANSHGLEEVIICCNTCASQIRLMGFAFIQKLSETDKKESKQEKEVCGYITHI